MHYIFNHQSSLFNYNKLIKEHTFFFAVFKTTPQMLIEQVWSSSCLSLELKLHVFCCIDYTHSRLLFFGYKLLYIWWENESHFMLFLRNWQKRTTILKYLHLIFIAGDSWLLDSMKSSKFEQWLWFNLFRRNRIKEGLQFSGYFSNLLGADLYKYV